MKTRSFLYKGLSEFLFTYILQHYQKDYQFFKRDTHKYSGQPKSHLIKLTFMWLINQGNNKRWASREKIAATTFAISHVPYSWAVSLLLPEWGEGEEAGLHSQTTIHIHCKVAGPTKTRAKLNKWLRQRTTLTMLFPMWQQLYPLPNPRHSSISIYRGVGQVGHQAELHMRGTL